MVSCSPTVIETPCFHATVMASSRWLPFTKLPIEQPTSFVDKVQDFRQNPKV